MSAVFNRQETILDFCQRLEDEEIDYNDPTGVNQIWANLENGSLMREETHLRDSLKVFPNLRFSFMKISFINSKLKKISELALAIVLIPLRVVQDIYYHAKQLVKRADLPNNNSEQVFSIEPLNLGARPATMIDTRI